MVECEPLNIPQEPKNAFRKFFYTVSISKPFELFISSIIMLNTILLCMDYAGASEQYNDILAKINIPFCVVFAVEVVIKLIGFGFTFYFSMASNIFDFIVTIASIITLFPMASASINLTAVRILRVARLLRLIKASKTLQD